MRNLCKHYHNPLLLKVALKQFHLDFPHNLIYLVRSLKPISFNFLSTSFSFPSMTQICFLLLQSDLIKMQLQGHIFINEKAIQKELLYKVF